MPGIEYNEFRDAIDCDHVYPPQDADSFVIDSIEATIVECVLTMRQRIRFLERELRGMSGMAMAKRDSVAAREARLAPVIDFMGWVANLDAVDLHNVSTDDIMRRAKRVELAYRGRDTTNGHDPRTTITELASESGQLHGVGYPDHE